jgi:hypothetical protein
METEGEKFNSSVVGADIRSTITAQLDTICAQLLGFQFVFE